MIGPGVAEDDAEQVLDLAGTDSHGDCGDGQAPHRGPVEREWRGRGGDPGRRRWGVGRLQPLLELSGMVVDGLPAAAGLPGLASDSPVTAGEDGGGVADQSVDR